MFDLLKKDDIQTILLKSRDRLSQLVESDLPEAKQKLLDTAGITIDSPSTSPSSAFSSSSSSSALSVVLNQQNRQNALTALDNLLASTTKLKPNLASLDKNISATLHDDSLKEEISSKFSAVMLTLGDASVTDSHLSNLVETFNAKTLDFQKLTGEVRIFREEKVKRATHIASPTLGNSPNSSPRLARRFLKLRP